MHAQDLDEEDIAKMQWIKEHIRRKSLVLWSVIRHVSAVDRWGGGHRTFSVLE